jgi:hypothetical protein
MVKVKKIMNFVKVDTLETPKKVKATKKLSRGFSLE